MRPDQPVNCVDITGYDSAIPGEVTLHYADVAGVYEGVYYAGRLKQPGLYTQNLFQAGTTSGESSIGSGETILMNSDGKLDNLINLGFDGREIVFKQFTIALGLVLIMSCTMEQPDVHLDHGFLPHQGPPGEAGCPHPADNICRDQCIAGRHRWHG